MYKKPSLSAYIRAKLVTIVIFEVLLYSLSLILIPQEYQNHYFHVSFFILSLLVMFYFVYSIILEIKKELKLLEKYLSGIESVENRSQKTSYLTKEFENINVRLIHLLRKIKKRDRKKRKYTAKIKLKNRQRSDMLSAIAHEFRNPIAAIMGYAQTLNDDEEIPPNLRKKFLNKIYNNGDKIEELLSRLLLWNRFESGEQKLQLSKFNIELLINDVALNLEEKYKNRQIVVSKVALNIRADRALMEIVIKNLIENALKYSDEIVEVKIEVNRVSIIDRGVGISDENIDKVTKKFFRTDEHSWDNSMGLGLAIVKQILKLHDMTLQIESEEHYGSTFSFTLS
ncbi:MAG: HAMP domain-containing histidine kinase [Sulfurovaceae bacterium]|nr:HAMP domain-containing histidine kinase [Sulfurovaceae bacterium]